MHEDGASISAWKESFPMMDVGFVCTNSLKKFSDMCSFFYSGLCVFDMPVV